MRCRICSLIPRNLKIGDEVDIYLAQDSGVHKFEGKGILRKFISTNDEPFPLHERCKGCKKQINVIKDKWIIERVDDKFLKGKEFTRNIIKFHSHGTIPINSYNEFDIYPIFKEYCTDLLENDPYLCEKLRKEIFERKDKTELFLNFKQYMDAVHGD